MSAYCGAAASSGGRAIGAGRTLAPLGNDSSGRDVSALAPTASRSLPTKLSAGSRATRWLQAGQSSR